VRVVIADDQELVRAALRMILEQAADIEVVGEAFDGAEALEVARHQRPDVLLMDIRIPYRDGLEATRLLVSQPGVATRVLILTTFEIDEYVFEAMRNCASGLLLRRHPRRAASGCPPRGQWRRPALTVCPRRLIAEFARVSRRPKEPAAELRTLTDRESEVLRLLAAGLSNAEFAQTLFLSDATAKTHVARILDKLASAIECKRSCTPTRTGWCNQALVDSPSKCDGKS
jgi:DNA-binding NarL/FixJ family response regulator